MYPVLIECHSALAVANDMKTRKGLWKIIYLLRSPCWWFISCQSDSNCLVGWSICEEWTIARDKLVCEWWENSRPINSCAQATDYAYDCCLGKKLSNSDSKFLKRVVGYCENALKVHECSCMSSLAAVIPRCSLFRVFARFPLYPAHTAATISHVAS